MAGSIQFATTRSLGSWRVVSSDDPLPVTGSFSSSTATTATAADPSYVEGSATNPLSVDLSGHLRVVDSTGKLVQAAAGSDATKAISIQGITGGKALPVSAISLPLPTGASTSAKQPALGTAGTASADVVSVQGIASMTALQIAGGTASGSAVANAPVTTGARAATANPTAVADGQVVNLMATKHGKLVTVDGAPRELRGTQKATLSNSTSETTIVTAGAAGVFNDLYGLILANTGATTTKADIRDATSGTIIATIEVPTLETRGFMLPAGSGIAQTTAANNWTAQCTAATTAMEVTALFIKTT